MRGQVERGRRSGQKSFFAVLLRANIGRQIVRCGRGQKRAVRRPVGRKGRDRVEPRGLGHDLAVAHRRAVNLNHRTDQAPALERPGGEAPHTARILARDEDPQRITVGKRHPPSIPVVEMGLQGFDLPRQLARQSRVIPLVGNQNPSAEDRPRGLKVTVGALRPGLAPGRDLELLVGGQGETRNRSAEDAADQYFRNDSFPLLPAHEESG